MESQKPRIEKYCTYVSGILEANTPHGGTCNITLNYLLLLLKDKTTSLMKKKKTCG